MASTRPLILRALATIGLLAATAACSAPATDASTDSGTGTVAGSGEAQESGTVTYDDDGAVVAFSYPGETGRTALDLLLALDPSATVEGEGELAFVTGIQGRAADPTSQFWSLDVDGEFAQVGAGSLETEDGQTITWTLTEFQ